MKPDFLTVADVLALHALQLQRYGGGTGIRDMGLLESAVSQPKATFDGSYLHPGLFEMAAAYLFHIVSNHAFVDGNKRTGLLAALVFLDLNGLTMTGGTEDLYAVTLGVADGRVDKDQVIAELERIFKAGC